MCIYFNIKQNSIFLFAPKTLQYYVHVGTFIAQTIILHVKVNFI